MNQQSLRIFSCLSSEVKSAPVGKTPKTNMGWSIQQRLNASCQALRDNNAVFWGLDVNLGHSILSSLPSPSMDFFFYFVPPSRQEVADMLAGVSHASDVWVERKVRRTEQEQLSDPPKNLITLSPPTFYCHECLPCEYWYTAPVWKCTLIKRNFCQTLITAYTKHGIWWIFCSSLRSCRRSTSPASTWMMSWILGAKLNAFVCCDKNYTLQL